jgi:hypothetical protein
MLRALFKAVVILAAVFICLMIVASVLSMTTFFAVPFLGTQAIASVARIPAEVAGGIARFAFMLGPVFVLGFLICLAVLALRLLGEHERPESRDEGRVLLEVHQDLSRMEERIEALETLLLTKRDRAGRRSRTSV